MKLYSRCAGSGLIFVGVAAWNVQAAPPVTAVRAPFGARAYEQRMEDETHVGPPPPRALRLERAVIDTSRPAAVTLAGQPVTPRGTQVVLVQYERAALDAVRAALAKAGGLIHG